MNSETVKPDQFASYRHWRVAMESLDACLNRTLGHDGLSLAELRVLVVLSEASDRRLRMSDLASDAHHSPSRSSHTITRMESRGWVKRIPHETDRRVIYVTTTPAGVALFTKVMPRYEAAIKRWFVDAVGAARINELDQDMCRIIVATNDATVFGV